MSGAPTPQIVEPGTAALLAEAAERFTTPCYVTDLRVLDQRAGELGAEFPDHSPQIRSTDASCCSDTPELSLLKTMTPTMIRVATAKRISISHRA